MKKIFLLTLMATTLGSLRLFGETVTVDGVAYDDVKWQRRTDTTVVIYHRAGVAELPLAKLPADVQEKLGYNPSPSGAPVQTGGSAAANGQPSVPCNHDASSATNAPAVADLLREAEAPSERDWSLAPNHVNQMLALKAEYSAANLNRALTSIQKSEASDRCKTALCKIASSIECWELEVLDVDVTLITASLRPPAAAQTRLSPPIKYWESQRTELTPANSVRVLIETPDELPENFYDVNKGDKIRIQAKYSHIDLDSHDLHYLKLYLKVLDNGFQFLPRKPNSPYRSIAQRFPNGHGKVKLYQNFDGMNAISRDSRLVHGGVQFRPLRNSILTVSPNITNRYEVALTKEGDLYTGIIEYVSVVPGPMGRLQKGDILVGDRSPIAIVKAVVEQDFAGGQCPTVKASTEVAYGCIREAAQHIQREHDSLPPKYGLTSIQLRRRETITKELTTEALRYLDLWPLVVEDIRRLNCDGEHVTGCATVTGQMPVSDVKVYVVADVREDDKVSSISRGHKIVMRGIPSRIDVNLGRPEIEVTLFNAVIEY
jgi:hypothetical protein